MKSNNHILGYLLLLSLLIGGISTSVQAQGKRIIIFGQVVDSITGKGLENIPVNVQSGLIFGEVAFNQNYTTNEKGYFYDTINATNSIERGAFEIIVSYEGTDYESSQFFRFNGRLEYYISSITKVHTDIPIPILQANFSHTNENLQYNAANISFTDVSISENTISSWFWDFGDGTYSSSQNPKHTYTEEGIYKVSLTITSSSKNMQISSIITHPIHIFMNYEFTLWGQVFLGDFFIPQSPELGYITLYKIDNDSIIAFDYQALTHNGNLWAGYAFNALPLGEYIVKATLDPSSEYFENYFTTYYGDIQQSSDAAIIDVYSNLGNLDIHLIEKGIFNTGEGQAIGEIVEESKESGVDDAYIYLTDNNDQPLLSINSNSQGIFGFKNLSNGCYKAYADITGLSCTPIIFTINDSNPTIGNLRFIVTENGIVGETIGIEESFNSFTQIFPNPCTSEVLIQSNLEQAATISIYNTIGNLLYRKNVADFSKTISINTTQWKEGIYFIKTTIDNKVSVNKLIKK